MAAAAGSAIQATGELTFGDASLAYGFYGNGTMVVGDITVTLQDANDAAFDTGALITLGNSRNARRTPPPQSSTARCYRAAVIAPAGRNRSSLLRSVISPQRTFGQSTRSRRVPRLSS